MNYKYFDFPIYKDSTHEVENLLNTGSANFYVFVKKSDWQPNNEALLMKILAAMKLNAHEEVGIFLLDDGQNVYIGENVRHQESLRFLAFGLNANRLGLQIKTIPYRINLISGMKVLFAHSLSDLSVNVEYKKRLWSLLQQFN